MDIWTVSTLGLLWRKLLRTQMHNFCMDMCLFLAGVRLEEELLGHMVSLWLIFWGTSRVFSQVAVLFNILTGSMRVPTVTHPRQHLPLPFRCGHPSGWEAVAQCGWICISLINNILNLYMWVICIPALEKCPKILHIYKLSHLFSTAELYSFFIHSGY